MRRGSASQAAATAAQRNAGGNTKANADADARQQNRGYSTASSRNERLHLLKQKRASDHALIDRTVLSGETATAGARAMGQQRSDGPTTASKAVRLSSVLQQAPQHFDRVKVRHTHTHIEGVCRAQGPTQHTHPRTLVVSRSTTTRN